MKVDCKQYRDVLVLSVDGRLDHGNADRFAEQIAPQVAQCSAADMKLVFDLSRLEYISSAGLRCFLVAAKQAKARAGSMVLAGLQPVVHEIFEISRFNALFPIYPGLREAVAELSPQALDALDGA